MAHLACDRLDGFLDRYNIEASRSGKRYVGPCPVHGGSFPRALNFYPDGYSARGNWQCHSNKCHEVFRSSLVGLVRGVLSNERHGWSRKGDKVVPIRDAVDSICEFLKIRFEDVRVDSARMDRSRFNRTVEILDPQGRPAGELCPREVFLKHHEIPSPYYLGRGFTPSTLRKFEVGECTSRKSPSFGRTSVPVYDPQGRMIIGVLSRSPHPRCERCRECHVPGTRCSSSGEYRPQNMRWNVQPKGFNDKHHLYNYWRAGKIISRSKCIVLVEGAGDVWRLDEAGILNAVGLMGSELTNLQDILIEECSPRHVVVMTDDDRAGNEVAEQIDRKWRRMAHVHRLKPVGVSEVGDMSTELVRRSFRGLIESWMQK